MKIRLIVLLGALLATFSCGDSSGTKSAAEGPVGNTMNENSFGEDLDFLKGNTEVILLSDEGGQGMAAIVPAWQARVMTSTCDGMGGSSFGWINYDLIKSGQNDPHINAFGGEDRFWMGPEGGQYSIFFKSGDPFDFDHWQTPAFIDTEPFEILSVGRSEASFRRKVQVQNYSGTSFNLEISRTIRILPPDEAGSLLGVENLAAMDCIAFESENRVKNVGAEAWNREQGLLSIWILGMYLPAPQMTIIVPYNRLPEETGPVVNDEYFGNIPAERLRVGEKAIFFSGDGEYRSKIGLDLNHAGKVLGSWDASRSVLTVVQFNKPDEAAEYVNSMWEMQENPFSGDVVNCYNDGIPGPGKEPLGPFYELETSSPALALAAGEECLHLHRTFHFKGSREDMDRLSRQVLGVSLDEAETAFAVE